MVFDDGIAVHQVEAPPSGADDDGGGTYAQESEQLGLRQLQYDSPLSDAEFLNRFRDIQRAGKEKQVHRLFMHILGPRMGQNFGNRKGTVEEGGALEHCLRIVRDLCGEGVSLGGGELSS